MQYRHDNEHDFDEDFHEDTPSLDTSFHDHEMDVDDDEGEDENEDRALLREKVNHLLTFHLITADQAAAICERINNLDDQVAVLWADAMRQGGL